MFALLDVRATGLSGEEFALRLLDEDPGGDHAGRKLRRGAGGVAADRADAERRQDDRRPATASPRIIAQLKEAA